MKRTKAEMKGLEDKFVAEEWIPPFLELFPVPLPKQKRKDNSEQ